MASKTMQEIVQNNARNNGALVGSD